MPGVGPPTDVLHFPGWELRPLAREVRLQGQPARLGDRAFDLLQALAARPGQVITKNELLDLVWPGRVVEENNLSVQIAALRRVLGPDVVQNVAGIGYRLAVLPLPLAQEPSAPVAAALAPAARPVGSAAPLLLGREADEAAVMALLEASPLVTLVGTGGVGKTTLARALASRLPAPADGTHWIDLTAQSAAGALPACVAAALGLAAPPDATPQALAPALATMRALVVLDNCEHRIDEVAALLAAVLPRAPQLRWLVTSQESLRVPQEVVHRLAPLPVPSEQDTAPDRSRSGALALFCLRVEAAGAALTWSDDQLARAAEICRRLDGLPLALEMAAARVPAFGLQGVHEQLEQRLRMRGPLRGKPDRQHSLLQTYEWSHALLSPLERQVFRSLHVFAGGFSAELVFELHRAHGGPSNDDWAVLDAAQALVDKSLVQAEPGGAPDGTAHRLRLLESAHEFAGLQLDAAGERPALRRAHAAVMADRMDLARGEYDRLRDRDWTARHAAELRNVRVALGWACEAGEPVLLARLVAGLGLVESFLQMASELAALPVPLARLRQAPPPQRALALMELGWAHHLDGSGEQATALAHEALADFEALGDSTGAYQTLTRLIRMYHGRPGRSTELRETWQRLQRIDAGTVSLRTRLNFESSSSYLVAAPRDLARLRELEALARRAGFDSVVATCQVNIVDELLTLGRDEEAVAEAQAVLAGGISLPRRRALVCHNLALALVRLGRSAEAREPARAVCRALPAQAHLVLDVFAYAAVQEGRLEDAALVAGCGDAIRRERDVLPEVNEASLIEATQQALRKHLAPARLQELLAAGAALPPAEALRLALDS